MRRPVALQPEVLGRSHQAAPEELLPEAVDDDSRGERVGVTHEPLRQSQPIARVSNLARFLRSLQDLNIWIVGTDERAPITLYEAKLTGPLAIVMGAEGKGMRHLTREHCDTLVRLPMQGVVESLNIAVAAGVCLYECLRQRG